MDKKEKIKQITYMIDELFYHKGREFKEKALKSWLTVLMRFPIKDLGDAFFKMICSEESFPNSGMIMNLIISNTSNDALFIWQDFEDYCQSISQYRHSMDDADLDIAHKWKKILGDDMDNIILICDSNQYLEADKTQKNIWKNQFLKSFKNDTKKIENYLLKNDSKLLEEK